METPTDLPNNLNANTLNAVKSFYRALTPAAIDGISDIYHPDVVFTDPAGSVTGCDKLQQHFERLLAGTQQCRFDFLDEQQLISGDSALLCWRMTLAVPPLARGQAFTVEGASRLTYQRQLIITHRDYFDLGAMFYEQLPLLGAIIRRLRRRLAAQ